MVGWVLKKHNYLSILISDFSVVVSKSTPDSSVDKHQYFSLDNIRLRLKWIKNDIPMKGAAFPLGLFCALYRTIHSSTTWHLCYENGSQLELWRERSGDITLYGCFKCSFSKSYQLSSSIIQCLWCMHFTCCHDLGDTWLLFSLAICSDVSGTDTSFRGEKSPEDSSAMSSWPTQEKQTILKKQVSYLLRNLHFSKWSGMFMSDSGGFVF